MTSPVTTVSTDTPAKEAAASMLAEGIRSVAVVGDHNRLVDTFTPADFVAIAAAADPAAAFLMAAT